MNRGTCARVARADLRPAGRCGRRDHGQQRARPCRPFEGTITGNPDTGAVSTSRSRSSGSRASRRRHVRRRQAPRAERRHGHDRRRRRSRTRTSRASRTSRPAARGAGDSFLKPDVTAPGVGIVSTGNGTGNGAATISGTSMASPHAAGVAALTRQAHPRKSSKSLRWNVREWKAAIINTADPSGVLGYRTSRGGCRARSAGAVDEDAGCRVLGEGAWRLAELRLRRAQGGLLEDAHAEDREPLAALWDVQHLLGAAERVSALGLVRRDVLRRAR